KTDKAGTAEFWLPPAVSSAEFFAWKTGIGLDCAKAILAEGEKAPLKLALRKAPTVPVRVVDALTNQPLPGVAVQCTIPRKPRSGVVAGTRGMEISAKTDGAGFAKIDWLPEWSVEEKITVWGEHPGYDADVGEMVLGKDKQITVKLAPLVRL